MSVWMGQTNIGYWFESVPNQFECGKISCFGSVKYQFRLIRENID